MIALIVIPLVMTLASILIGGFHFSTLLIIIARIIFGLKLLGVKIKITLCMVFEGLGIFFILMRPVLAKRMFTARELIVYLVAGIVMIAIELVDDYMYVYTEEEVNEHDADND